MKYIVPVIIIGLLASTIVARQIHFNFMDSKCELKLYSKEDIGEELMSTVVEVGYYINDDQTIGSGTIIDTSGIILTNFHVVTGSESLQIRTMDGEIYELSGVLAFDPIKDYAFVVADTVGKPNFSRSVQISWREKVRTGENCYVLGNPLGLSFSFSAGDIAYGGEGRKISTSRWGGYSVKMIHFTAAISPGNSGGALFDDFGCMIGIPTGYEYVGTYYNLAQNVNFAVPVWEISEIIDGKKHHAPVETSDTIFSKEIKPDDTELEIIPWEAFYAFSGLLDYMLELYGDYYFYYADDMAIILADYITGGLYNPYFFLTLSHYWCEEKDSVELAQSVLSSFSLPDNPYYYYVKCLTEIKAAESANDTLKLKEVFKSANKLSDLAPAWKEDIESDIEFSLYYLRPYEDSSDYPANDELLDEYAYLFVEDIIVEHYDSIGLRVYKMIDGVLTAEEIRDSTGVSEIWLVEFLEFLDENSLIELGEKSQSKEAGLKDSIYNMQAEIANELFDLSNLFIDATDTNGAIASLEACLKINPADYYCGCNLILILSLKGDYKTAKEYGIALLEQDNLYSKGGVYALLSEILVELEEYEYSLACIDSCREYLYYLDLSNSYQMAALEVFAIADYAALHQIKEAEVHYQTLIEFYPEWEDSLAGFPDWIFFENTVALFNQFLEEH
ncbi:serine protease [bacterium]|nr:serine protease [bacterium]